MICSICSKTMRDPRILPCGKSACHECIQSRVNAATFELECLNCKKQHLAPNRVDGFYLNMGLQVIIEAKANELYWGKKVENLKSKLAEIQQEGVRFQANYVSGANLIKEHCLKLRNQIQLRTDILLEQVHQYNEKLIGEIDKYERECIDSFENKISDKENEFSQLLIEMSDFYTDKVKYLTEFVINGNTVKKSLAKADNYLERLKSMKNSLKDFKFDGKLMKFKPNETEHDSMSLLGSFDFSLGCPLSFDFDNVKEIQLSQVMPVGDDYNRLNLFRTSVGIRPC